MNLNIYYEEIQMKYFKVYLVHFQLLKFNFYHKRG